MTLVKKTMKLFLLAMLVSFTSCQNKYPDLGDGIYAEIVTNKGTMVAQLEYQKTPVTVANFITLAEGTNHLVDSTYQGKKFYNGLTFHRIIKDFMIQGGDPEGTGRGNPGYKFKDEFDATLVHDTLGILSMANSGPATNGSQFFITLKATPWLNNKHSVFGHLVEGNDVLTALGNIETTKPGDKPKEDVIIQEVNIIRKGEAAQAFNASEVFKNHFVELEQEKKEREAKLNAAREEFIKQNESPEGTVKRLPTGVVMIYNNENPNGVKPTSQDKVLINYAGYFEDGQLFDTNYKYIAEKFGKYDENRDKRGAYKPFPMIYNERATLVPGFREAMLNMNVGDKARVFIPSFLAYGERGMPPVIPANTNLIFDLEITGIQE